MKAAQAVLLFEALIGLTTCLFHRTYTFVQLSLSWTDAQAYCRKNYVDLLTITSQGDLSRLKNNEESSMQSWIGLSKKPQETVYTQWSDGSELTFSAWKGIEPSNLKTFHCVTIINSGFAAYNCTSALMFYCYKWSPDVVVVQEMMKWEEALTYCRMHYMDLVSITTETDQYVVMKSLKNQTSSVWTGLRFMNGLWFWVNQKTLQSPSSLPICPVRPFLCGSITNSGVLRNGNCNEKMRFICYYLPQ